MKKQIENVRCELLSYPMEEVRKVVISFTINGREQKWATFIKSNSKWKNQDYINEAKAQFNQAIKEKKNKFHKNYGYGYGGANKFLIVLSSILGITTLGLGGFFVYQHFFVDNTKEEDVPTISLTIDDKIYTYGKQYITCTISADSKQKANFSSGIKIDDIVLPDIAGGRFVSGIQMIGKQSILFCVNGSANTIPTQDETPIDIVIKQNAFEDVSCDAHISTYFCRNRVCITASSTSSTSRKDDIIFYGATIKPDYLRDSSLNPFTLNIEGEYRDPNIDNKLIFKASDCDYSLGNSKFTIYKTGMSSQVNRFELTNLVKDGWTAAIKLCDGSTTLEGYECEIEANPSKPYYFIPVPTN